MHAPEPSQTTAVYFAKKSHLPWILGLIFLFSICLQFILPTQNSWSCIVLQNWHQYGFWELKGQLVANPGGLLPGETWDVYPRHRPAFLYLPYLLLGGGDSPLRTSLYCAVMLGLVAASMGALFRSGSRGAFAALFLALCPGFVINIWNIDTISYPAVLAIAVMALAGSAFTKKDLSQPELFGVITLLALFLLTNWSAMFSLGILIPYVLVKNPGAFRRLAVLLIPLGILSLIVLAISLSDTPKSSSGSSNLWNSYLFGPLGYDGNGMNWPKALTRISAVNVVAWLPLGGLAAFFALRNGIDKSRGLQAFLPLFAGICIVLLMRNYNAHHPWGAVSFVGLGLLLTLELLTKPENEPNERPPKQMVARTLIVLLALAYFGTWVIASRNNTKEFSSLKRLIAHTGRQSTIVTADNWVPKDFQDQNFMLLLDRKMVSQAEWNQNSAAIRARGTPAYLLTHLPNPSQPPPFAHSSLTLLPVDALIEKALAFYRKNLSKRSAKDRVVFYPEYCLYQL